MKVIIYVSFMAIIIGTVMGCTHVPPKAGPPIILQVSEKENPDVIWIVRRVDMTGKKVSRSLNTSTHHGLFACYRTSTPGYPKCYLSKIIGESKSLVWPDSPDNFYLPQ